MLETGKTAVDQLSGVGCSDGSNITSKIKDPSPWIEAFFEFLSKFDGLKKSLCIAARYN